MKAVTLTLGIVSIFAVNSARAVLVAYEGFDQGASGSTVLNTTGGFGFTSAWLPGGFNATEHANYTIKSGSLGFGGLALSGDSAQTAAVLTGISGLTRTLDDLIGGAGTTYYFSFLLRPQGVLNQGYLNGFFGLVLEANTEPEVFIGKVGSQSFYGIENRGGGDRVLSNVPVVIGETALLVVRADFGVGSDTFTLYVNPTPGAAEPTAGFVKDEASISLIYGLTLYSTGAHQLDEIRVGTTYADVVPVPEPSSLLAGALGLGVVAMRRRPRAR